MDISTLGCPGYDIGFYEAIMGPRKVKFLQKEHIGRKYEKRVPEKNHMYGGYPWGFDKCLRKGGTLESDSCGSGAAAGVKPS